MVEQTTEDLASLRGRIEPELQKLIKAKLVAKIGEEYEFLTGERRTFEEDVANIAAGYKRQDLDAGLAKFISKESLGVSSVSYKGTEFPVRVFLTTLRSLAMETSKFVFHRHSPRLASSSSLISKSKAVVPTSVRRSSCSVTAFPTLMTI